MVIRLKKNKEKAILNFHPWVFSGAIASGENDLTPGSIVRVESITGSFLAWGHYDPKSQIRIRLFSFEESKNGSDDSYWMDHWNEIYESKKNLIPKDTTGFRLFHSEGDSVPGIVVDCYHKTAVMQLKTPGALGLRKLLISFLESKGYETIFERTDKPEGNKEGESIFHKGEEPEPIFTEHGIRFISDITKGQKTGFFLDQRENRALVAHYASGRKVLNTFSYSGAFSVYALLAGAELVHSLDISKQAIDICERNLVLNGLSSEGNQARHKGLVQDSFDYLKSMESSFYDLIILDPPAFTKSISTVNQASRGYKDINMRAISKIQTGGLIFTFSCSQHISFDLFKKIVFGAAKDAKKRVRILHHLTQSPDHGYSVFHPEGEYLKGLVIQVDGDI
ncbi:class I SAM-dependent rRNA methyltransferase [Leptospira brenneri]|uniref:class I SAM-dependent rRNA methyltransferase n=1 Tax=Leptospira brenneri TaxID=2023182 RepID=UPI000C29C8CD|nr:class I SAM-dependent rRNA methyltransferase [Leptospira brenneri]PJZ45317.1 SAM-dependent methyltransferase [Leptospira brenneri]